MHTTRHSSRPNRPTGWAALLAGLGVAAAGVAGETEPNDSFAQATDISCPAFDSAGAAIGVAGDVDYYRVNNATGLLVVDVDGDILGTGLDSRAGVFDAAGEALFINDDGAALGEPPGFTDAFVAVPVGDTPATRYVVVGSGGDSNLDGVADPDAQLSTGAYTLSVRCEPSAGVPATGALMASTGRYGATLIDLDPATGAGSLRSSLGAYGPVTDIAFCGGRLYGTTGAGSASVLEIDPVSGVESFYCSHEGFAINGLECLDGALYGSYIPQSGGASLSSLVIVESPVTQTDVQTFVLDAATVDGAEDNVLVFARSAGGPVQGVGLTLQYTATSPSRAAAFHLTVTHLLSGTTVAAGSTGPGGSCATLPCDADLGWPDQAGTYSAQVAMPVAQIADSTGPWQVTLRDTADDPGQDGVIVAGAVSLSTTRCPLQLIGPNGFKTVAGLAWDAPSATLFGCTAAFDGFFGSLIAQDPATGAGTLVGPMGIDSCGALAFDPAGATLYAGSGSADATPGALLTVDPATGAGTPVGATGFPGLSGLAFFPPDTDADGRPDAIDNCPATANADQIDSNTDGIGNRCDQDYNNDCFVNFADLATLKAAFLSSPGDANYNPDVSVTGGQMPVNFFELALFKAAFAQPPGPGGPGNDCEVAADR